MKGLGSAWIVLEESFHLDDAKLIAVLSPRKPNTFIAEYIEQAYVDRFASFDEKISFKKNRNNSPYRIESYMIQSTTISLGHDPMFNAYKAHKLERNGENLIFYFRVYKGELGNREATEHIKTVQIS